eukprot:tig00021037_g17435.t1
MSAEAHATAAEPAIDAKFVHGRVQEVLNDIAQASTAAGRSKPPRLVAVSKTKPVELLQGAYDAGQRHFGENYVQELVDKAPVLPQDIQWHFIGTFQSNKAKLLAQVPSLYMVETINSAKGASALDRAWGAAGHSRKLRVLVQVNTSAEESKSGADDIETTKELCRHVAKECPNLEFGGLMTIGAPDDSEEPAAFKLLSDYRTTVAQSLGLDPESLELSMGMSGDWRQALRMGSTNIRLGSTIFGARNYGAH